MNYDNRLIDIIQKPFVMELMVYIGDHPDCSKADAIGIGNERTRYLRLEDMKDWGLITISEPSGQYHRCRLNLTDVGSKFYNAMKNICLLADEYKRETS